MYFRPIIQVSFFPSGQNYIFPDPRSSHIVNRMFFVKAVKSVILWICVIALIIVWLPVLAFVRLFDRDPVRYRTGRTFRLLGKWMTKINPEWKLHISGRTDLDDRHPYIIVCNHLSNADIPLISNLPWEMKWIAKKELFGVPFVGWMMKLAGDIPVDRSDPKSQVSTLKQSLFYLRNNCSLMFFPEGTRSRSGKLGRFTKGAFHLALREQVPVLPLVIDGTQNCLPKRSWTFGSAPDIRLKVLDPVPVDQFDRNDAGQLLELVRSRILEQLSDWRNLPETEIDAARR